MAKDDGCLLLGPMYRNAVVGYICIVTDPDGNNVEFSVEQVLGLTAPPTTDHHRHRSRASTTRWRSSSPSATPTST